MSSLLARPFMFGLVDFTFKGHEKDQCFFLTLSEVLAVKKLSLLFENFAARPSRSLRSLQNGLIAC